MRKLRFGDSRRAKGKRGGLRVIYYYRTGGPEFWLFTLYNKNEMADLTAKQRTTLKERVRTLENWEQGRAKPNAQAALLIRMVPLYPDTVRRLAEIR